MPFLKDRYWGGTLVPRELTIVRNVFDRVVAAPWVSTRPDDRAELARYILRMYDRGLCDEEKLYAHCLVAARHKFAKQETEAIPAKV